MFTSFVIKTSAMIWRPRASTCSTLQFNLFFFNLTGEKCKQQLISSEKKKQTRHNNMHRNCVQ